MKKALLPALLSGWVCLAFALSGYADTELFTLDTVPPELQLHSPNGGELWYIGDTHDITWTASDTNLTPNSVYLWYSVNGGLEYLSLAEAIANSGSHPWEIPAVQTNLARVRVRVSDDFGYITQKTSLANFTISYVPPAEPEGVLVDILNGLDAVISWQPVTQTIYGTPITPDGYIVLYNETPYEDEQFFYFLGRTFTTSYTHHDVAEFRDQMFYRVVAYKYYRDEDFRRLELLAGERSLPWGEALLLLTGGVK